MTETLRVVILGAGGSSPPPGYAGPAVLVDDGGSRLLLDCGESCLSRLRLLGYNPCDVDAVYVTHAHIDHWAGVFPLMVARCAEGCRALVIHAHPAVAEALRPMIESIAPRCAEPRVEASEEFTVGRMRVVLAETSHSAPNYAAIVVVDGEAKLVYTGDTRLEERVAEALGREGPPRLLVAEANFAAGQEELARETGHMTVNQAFELRERLGAELLIPVHLTPLSLRQLLAYRRMPPRVITPVDGVSVTV